MKPQRLIASLLILSLTAFTSTVQADVKLHGLFSDHAVLLSGAAVPVWGWADAGENVEVSFAGQTKSATPDANGKWMVKLDALKAEAKPQELTVKGKNTLTVKDVLVGEVWLGSGQSNMALPVSKANDYEKEMGAAQFPQLRMFSVRSKPSATASENCGGKWSVCSPETVGGFSAALHFFGREIHKTLGVPTGLINSSVNGTRIERWSAPDAQVPDAAADPAEKSRCGELFNGKIAPLIPYAIRQLEWHRFQNV